MREPSLAEKRDLGDRQARHHKVPWECAPSKDDPTWQPGPPAEDVEAEYHDGAVRASNEALQRASRISREHAKSTCPKETKNYYEDT